MKISVVVPAFNEEKLISATLDAVKGSLGVFENRGWQTEVIVCDNNSTDQTASIARALGANVVFEPVNQIARARNTGAAAASGDWLLFVDADSLPNPGLFEDVLRTILSGRYLFGGVVLRFDSAPFAARMTVHVWNTISRWKKLAAGSFLFCDTKAFREIGGFDVGLYASEELDLSQRLRVHARIRGLDGIILTRNPMVTSGRKLKLYTQKEHIRFMFRAFTRWRKVLGSREECHIWYDGRR